MLTAASVLGIACPSHATPVEGVSNWFNTTGDSNWFNAANWRFNTLPGLSATAALIDEALAFSSVVDLQGSQTPLLASLDFANAGGGFDVRNGTIRTGSIYCQTLGLTNVISADVTTSASNNRLFSCWSPDGASVIYRGVVKDRAAGNPLRLVGNFVFEGANTYTGPTQVERVGRLRGANGSNRSSTSFQIEDGLLELDNTAGANSNRMNDAADVQLMYAGQLSLIGNASQAVTEDIGTLALSHGRSTIRIADSAGVGAPSTVLRAQRLARSSGVTFDIALAGNAALQLNTLPTADLVGGGGAAGSTTMSILPYATAQHTELVTVDGPSLRPLSASEYASTLPTSGITQQNVALALPQSVGDDTTVNAIVLRNGSAISIASGKTLAVTSGVVTFAGEGSSQSIGGGGASTLAFGNKEGVITAVNADARYAIDVAMSGAAGIIKTGPGKLLLNQPNAHTGGTRINQGMVVSAVQGAFGTGPIQLAGGEAGGGPVGIEFPQSQSVPNAIVLDTSFGFDSASGRSTLTNFSVAPSATVTLTGPISGYGNLEKFGSGTLAIAGTSSFNFVTVIAEDGTLRLDSTVQGNGAILISDARLCGTGSYQGQVTMYAGGVMSPGNGGRGTFGAGLFFMQPDSTLETFLSESGVNTLIAGRSSLNGTLDINTLDGFLPTLGQSFTVIDNTGTSAIQGTFSGLPEGSRFSSHGMQFQITYLGNGTRDVVVTVVPEPATLGLVMIASAVCSRRPRRRGRREV